MDIESENYVVPGDSSSDDDEEEDPIELPFEVQMLSMVGMFNPMALFNILMQGAGLDGGGFDNEEAFNTFRDGCLISLIHNQILSPRRLKTLFKEYDMDINRPVISPFGTGTTTTTFLIEACAAHNYRFVQFLLEDFDADVNRRNTVSSWPH
jgi:hypothetical protein